MTGLEELILAFVIVGIVTVVKVIVAHHHNHKIEKQKAALEAQVAEEVDDDAEIEVDTLTIEVNGVKTTFDGIKIHPSHHASTPPTIQQGDSIGSAIMDGVGGALSASGIPFADAINGVSSAAGHLVNYVHKKYTKHTDDSHDKAIAATESKPVGFFSNLFTKAKSCLGFGIKDTEATTAASINLKADADQDLDAVDENSQMLPQEIEVASTSEEGCASSANQAADANIVPEILGDTTVIPAATAA
jgi:hypothetical protein